MIQLTDDKKGAVWVGNSSDMIADVAEYRKYGIGALLNVAIDLHSTHGWWDRIEAAHVGLVDGPGNETSVYCAAILTLHWLTRRHNTLVVCHDSGRALAVCVMYLNLVKGKFHGPPSVWSHLHRNLTWDERLAEIEKFSGPLPHCHRAHILAFADIPFGVLEALI